VVPDPVIAVIGLLARGDSALAEAVAAIESCLGAVLFRSASYHWEFSSYYEKEMGRPLLRQFLGLDLLVAPETLPQLKVETSRLEERLSVSGQGEALRRRVNIDPGYVDRGKLVLASGKFAAHRIYLGDGTFAEIALVFENGRFRPLPTTYQDYGQPRAVSFFGEIRKHYLRSLRGLR